jgi:hypothetical protein
MNPNLNEMTHLFNKLVQFTRYLKTGGCFREFNFLKVNGKAALTYLIDVSDELGIRYQFSLSFDGKNWNLLSDLTMPKWINDAREMLQQEVTAAPVANAES